MYSPPFHPSKRPPSSIYIPPVVRYFPEKQISMILGTKQYKSILQNKKISMVTKE